MPSPDLDNLTALRDHHLSEARRIDDAIALLKDVARMRRSAERKVGKVRQMAARALTPPPPPTRLRPKAKPHSPRPTDVVRQAFIAAGSKTMTAADLLDITGFVGMNFGGKHDAVGNARRVLGLTLARMTKAREIKKQGAGYVAKNIPPINGADLHT